MYAEQIEINLDSDDEPDRGPGDGSTRQDLAQAQFDEDFAAANEKHREMKARKGARAGNGDEESSEESRRKQTDIGIFAKDRGAKWSCTTFEGRNFLHYLAYKDPRRDPAPKWLIQLAILSRPELMREMDSKRRTPLTGMQHDNDIHKWINI